MSKTKQKQASIDTEGLSNLDDVRKRAERKAAAIVTRIEKEARLGIPQTIVELRKGYHLEQVKHLFGKNHNSEDSD